MKLTNESIFRLELNREEAGILYDIAMRLLDQVSEGPKRDMLTELCNNMVKVINFNEDY